MGRTTDIKCYYSGTRKWVKPLIWAEGPPIGLYWTAAVQGPSSLWVEFAVSPHVHRKATLYLGGLDIDWIDGVNARTCVCLSRL